MKNKLLHSFRLRATMLVAMMLCVVNTAWAQSDYSDTQTSNVTLTAGTNGSACTVNGYDGIKVGTSKKGGGDMSITVPAGTTHLHLHAAAWNAVTDLSLNISGATTDPESIDLTADSGIANSSPFTLSGSASDFYFVIELSDITEETTLTFETSKTKRFVIWGVNAEEYVQKTDNDLTITSASSVNLTMTSEVPSPTATVTYSTSSDGALTWATSNADVATVSNGVITAVGAGTCDITVTQAATSAYTASDIKTITVTVTDNTRVPSDLTLTGAPIALSFDLYNNATPQSVSYTTSGTGTVTVSSSEYISTSVDEGNKTITVTPRKVTAEAQTITISQAADSGHRAGEVTFTVTITDSTPITEETITFSEKGYENGAEVASAAASAFTITFDKGTNTNNAPKYYGTGEAIRTYGGNNFTVSSTTKIIKKVELTFSSNGEGTNEITTDNGTFTTDTWTGWSATVTFTVGGTSGHRRIASIKVTYGDDQPATPSVTVTAAGYTAYTTYCGVTFPAEVTAYIVTATNTDEATLTAVDEAPAGTPLIVKAAAGTYNLTVKADAAAAAENNLLQASNGTKEGDGSTIFALGNKDGVGFYVVGDGVKVPAGKPYLEISGSAGIKSFLAFNFGTPTAISGLDAQKAERGTIYNLAGQRVNKAVKGIFIQNGKKVVVK